jgi:hypothetical protein
MKPSPRSPRPTSNLHPSVDRLLDAYALAANAAGVSSLSLAQPADGKSDSVHRKLSPCALAATAAGAGLLALAQSAQAKIVYTPTNVTITNSGVGLDLNHDGVSDFLLSYYCCGYVRFLKVVPHQSSNEIVDHASPNHPNRNLPGKTHICAAALTKGVRVGPKSPFHQDPVKGLYMFIQTGNISTSTSFGPWLGLNGQRYLGLKFVVNGETHYGWARVNVGRGYTLTGYAYETIPNKPIITGATKGPDETNLQEPEVALTTPARQPPSLGMLALGAPGLSIWRREEATTLQH